jgi:hypothetical protein
MNLKRMKHSEQHLNMNTSSTLTYHAIDLKAKLGDIVEVKYFFKRLRGNIIYLPGVSLKHPLMEYEERYYRLVKYIYIGIDVNNEPLVKIRIAPHAECLPGKIVFLERTPQFEGRSHVVYCNECGAVEIGDHVELTDFFKRTRGRVIYVPGISTHPDLDYDMNSDPYQSVGIDTEKSCLVIRRVNPINLRLEKEVQFIKRDTSPVKLLRPNVRIT